MLSAVTLTGPPVEPGPPVKVTTANGVAVPEMVGVTVVVMLLGVVIAIVGGQASGVAVTTADADVTQPDTESVTV